MNMNVSKTNGIRALALIAVLAMVVCAFAAIMPASEVDAADDSYTLRISDSVSPGEPTVYPTNATIIVVDDLVIPEGAILVIKGTFIINEGVTMTVEAGGLFIVDSSAKVTIDGNLVATGSNTITTGEPEAAEETVVPSIINNLTSDDNEKTYFVVNGSLSLERGAVMSTYDDFEVDSVTKSSDLSPVEKANTLGEITLNEGATLSVSKWSSNISMIANQTILVNEGATVTINAHVGNVVVKSTGNASYRTEAAVGLNTDEFATYADTKRTTSNLTFTVTAQSVSATPFAYGSEGYEQTNGQKFSVRQYILNVDGKVDAGDDISTIAGKSINPDDECVYYKAIEYESASTNIISPIVSVSGTLDVAVGSTITIGADSYLDVSGALSLGYKGGDAPTAANLVLGGTLHVTGTVTATELVVDEKSNITNEQATGTHYVTALIIVDDGSIEITSEAGFDLSGYQIWGTSYEAELTDSDKYVTYIMNFEDAIAAATTAQVENVSVYAFGAQNRSTAEYAAANGAYTITGQVTIPADMTLTIENALIVSETGELVISDGAYVAFNKSLTNGAVLWNNGKVVDYGGGISDYEDENKAFTTLGGQTGTRSGDYFVYEVKKTTETETETIVTYTTLAIAIDEAQDGETIQLNGLVQIKENLTIPANVTVVADDVDSGSAISVEGVTLTVNGILDMKGETFELVNKDGTDGSIVVNNFIANVATQNFTTSVEVPGAYFTGTIGEDYDNVPIIASAAVAGTNSTSTAAISIYGKLSMGDVTFTQGENQPELAVTVYDEVSGNVTLVGNDVTYALGAAASPIKTGSFTGTVTYAATGGNIVVDFSKAGGLTVETTSSDDGTAVTTGIALSGNLIGSASITSGAVDIGTNNIAVSGYDNDGKVKSVLTVGTGATLNVNANKLTVNKNENLGNVDDYAGLVVAGTLNLGKGTIDNKGIIDVTGTMNVTENGKSVTNVLNVTGTMNVADGKALTVTSMYVGDADGAAGTVSGKITITDGFIAAYPTANISGAVINDENSEAYVTEFYVNGNLYLTAYSLDTNFNEVITGDVKIPGYAAIANTSWNTSADMKGDTISTTEPLSDVPAAYAEAKLLDAGVYVSIGNQITVYIDDLRVGSGYQGFTVGEHTITVQVTPGYTGTPVITLGGQTITGGTFTITTDMAEDYEFVDDGSDNYIVLSIMVGDLSIDTGATGGDDGMGLTEILLIILVVLIVVMAIMVALRLMRS